LSFLNKDRQHYINPPGKPRNKLERTKDMTTEQKNRLEPSPIFEIGKVPKLPHCVIKDRHYDGVKWNYYIYNQYNSYASGWGDEDFIIQQIASNTQKH
jgi:hypothetical protein